MEFQQALRQFEENKGRIEVLEQMASQLQEELKRLTGWENTECLLNSNEAIEVLSDKERPHWFGDPFWTSLHCTSHEACIAFQNGSFECSNSSCCNAIFTCKFVALNERLEI